MIIPLKSLLLALHLVGNAFARKHMREVQIGNEVKLLEEEAFAAEDCLEPPCHKVVASEPPPVFWGNTSLPIDHGNPQVGNFSNRFWVVDAYYRPGGPVFVFDTGESNGGDKYIGYLTRNTTFFHKYLVQFNAIGIIWEHRYYGESKPFPVDLNTSARQMQYLTTEAALKDFTLFANQFSWTNATVNPEKTPWVVVGGSYPGMRAAFWRNLYPDTVYAAYASSAPVQARKDMSVYFEQAYRGMVQYGLKNCTEYIKHAVDYIDSQLDAPCTAKKIKLQYLGRTADRGSNAGFADMLTYPFYGWQSGGVDATIRSWCDHLDAEKPSTEEKLLGKFYSDRWASWPTFKDLVNEYNSFGYCEGPVRNESAQVNCLLDERFSGDLGISWTWQYCTEWGFFQSTNIGPHALGSRYQSLEHQQDICYRQFPDGLSSGLLPKEPRVSYINSVMGGWRRRPTNTFFTGGEFDPWRTLSPLSTEPFSLKLKVTNEIPKCGMSTAEDEVFGYLLPNAEHCYDFRDTIPARAPTALFAQALEGWLKCFKRR